jgi:hypothetical protein
MSEPVKIPGFSGINNVQDALAGVFQVSAQPNAPRPALVAATDVDLDDDGWVSSRKPLAVVDTLTAGHGGWSANAGLLVQDGGNLLSGVTAVVSGLGDRVLLCDHWGRVYVTDGSKHYEIDDVTATNWGLPVPTVSLSPGIGNLDSGMYLVQATFVDAAGNEGGTSRIQTATLTTATGISMSITGVNASVRYANVYCSLPEQQLTTFVATIPIGAFPYTIRDVSATLADPPKTEQMTGPISNADGIFSFRAFLMMWRDNVVFRSEGMEPHLFHGDNIMQFGSNVTACEGLLSGMWIGTEGGLWWVSGDDPEKWIPTRKTSRKVAVGSMQIDGEKIPKLQTSDRVALFIIDQWLVAGLSDGRVVGITDNIYRFGDVGRAGFCLSESGNTKQLLIGVINE